MSFLGVSINCTSNNLPHLSASGIKICDHFILTHCSIVWEILSDCASKNASLLFIDKDFKRLQHMLSQVILEINAKFSVVLPVHYDNLNSRSLQDDVTHRAAENDSNSSFEKHSALAIEAFLEEIVIFPLLFWEFLDLLYPNNQWKFDKSEDKKIANDNSLENIFLSTFVILRIKRTGGNIDACFGNFEDLTSLPSKGTTILIDGCPFGFESARTVFLNSLSKGIISNISQSGAIILTDARCIHGCEGAPAYSLDDSFQVCGIVLSPFCWFKGEWVGFTFMAAIQPFLAYIRKTLQASGFLEAHPIAGCLPEPILLSNHGDPLLTLDDETPLGHPSNIIKEARLSQDVVNVMNKSIVRIKRNGSDEWGTGVIAARNKGLVVSCAHVTQGSIDKVVRVVFWDGRETLGVVIFESKPSPIAQHSGSRQKDNDFVMWDLAVIQLPIQPRHSLPLSSEIPSIGTPVFIGGHPLFKADVLSSPTFSLGNLASINWAFRKSGLPPGNAPQQCQSKSLMPSSAVSSSVTIEGLTCTHWRHCSLSDDAIPLVMQTTCAVYNGVSGGPVAALHPSKGAVVIGIVSCSVKDVNTKVSFPHVNLATPVFLLAEAIDHFNRTKDPRVFDSLTCPPADAKKLKFNSVWKSKL